MNHGQLRDLFTDGNTLTPAILTNLCEDAQNIVWMLFEIANSSHNPKEEIPPDVREEYEKLLDLLPKGLKVCLCVQENNDKSLLGASFPRQVLIETKSLS